MVSLLLSKAPQCMSCVRRMVGVGEALQFPARQQVRGKKKLAKVSTVNVRLLQNVPGYGRKGSIVPVTAGVMRNIWYSKKMAEYMTDAKLSVLGRESLNLERDATFGTNQERKELSKQIQKEKKDTSARSSGSAQEEPIIRVELELPSPAQGKSILERLLPANIDFYRTPVSVPQPPPKRISPSIPTSSAVSSAAAAAAVKDAKPESEPKKSGKTSIYGSVSTGDIAANLRAVLADDEEGALVTITSDEISFVAEVEDKDRVKELGVFEIEIRLGSSDPVRRTIKVNAQD